QRQPDAAQQDHDQRADGQAERESPPDVGDQQPVRVGVGEDREQRRDGRRADYRGEREQECLRTHVTRVVGSRLGGPGSSTFGDGTGAAASSVSARDCSVSGMSRIAPSGPISQAQNTSAKKVTVTDSPTASPMKRGWM